MVANVHSAIDNAFQSSLNPPVVDPKTIPIVQNQHSAPMKLTLDLFNLSCREVGEFGDERLLGQRVVVSRFGGLLRSQMMLRV